MVLEYSDKRFEKLTVINEKDCIKVIPKGWLDKQIWKEINDILSASIRLAVQW
jgi:hypothetical protein